jgi:hypothetical protein
MWHCGKGEPFSHETHRANPIPKHSAFTALYKMKMKLAVDR